MWVIAVESAKYYLSGSRCKEGTKHENFREERA